MVPLTSASGIRARTSERARAYKSGPMAVYTRATGSLTKPIFSVVYFTKMAIFIKVNGLMTKHMASATISIRMVVYIVDSGRTILKTARALNAGQTVQGSRVTTSRESKTAMEFSRGPMGIATRATSFKITFKAKVRNKSNSRNHFLQSMVSCSRRKI